jgi:hypothetical protein
MSNKMNRRSFFGKTVVASGAAAGLGYSLEEKALLARQALAATPSEKEEPIKGLPQGKIGDIELSRVILGCNPLMGGVHARNLYYIYPLARKYMTKEKIMETLQLAEENGINTVLIHQPHKASMDAVADYNKRGGHMQVIMQLTPPGRWLNLNDPDSTVSITKEAIDESVASAAEKGCVGAFLLGCLGDRWVKAKRFDLLQECISCIRANGMIAGIGGHDKRVPVAVEKAGIDVDFYFKTIHPDTYWGTIPEEEKRPFVVDSSGPDDHDCMWELYPQETIENMRKITKPWVGYKVLAAGAVPPTEAFQFAFENGADFISAGMFDWEVRENVQIAKEILARDEVKNRARPWRA